MPPKGRPSYKRSLQPSKEVIQQFKTWNFLHFLYFLWAFFSPGGPDPEPYSGSGFRIWIKIPNLDPDKVRIHRSDSIRIRIQSGSKTLGSVPGFRIRNFFTDLDPGGQLIMDPAGSWSYMDFLVAIETIMYKQVIWFLLYFLWSTKI